MNRLTRFACFAAVMGGMANAANAAFISRSSDPLLGGNLVSQGAPILSPFGYVTFNITNIKQISNITNGANQFIT